MQNCHKAFGARITLVASSASAPQYGRVPSDGRAPGADEGSIRIECENHSMVPVDVVLRKLLSSNPDVAEAEGIAHKTVYLGRRRSITHLDEPAAVTSTVGSWRPVAGGQAFIQAVLHMLDPRYFLFCTLAPSAEVEVAGEAPSPWIHARSPAHAKIPAPKKAGA
jgi:hypothetical protein